MTVAMVNGMRLSVYKCEIVVSCAPRLRALSGSRLLMIQPVTSALK